MPRPRSESFYLNLAPNVSAALSIHTKASLSGPRSPPAAPTTATGPTVPAALTSPTRSFPFSRTPAIRSPAPAAAAVAAAAAALADDADDERDPASPPAPPRRRSTPDLRFAHPPRHPWSPAAPSPLRRDASRPFCPSSLFTTHAPLLPLYPLPAAPPSPLHPRSAPPRPSLEAAALALKSPARRRTPLYTTALKQSFFAGAAGSSVRRFGVRTAWNINEDVRRSLATDHLHSIFEFSSSDENDDNDEEEEEEEEFASPIHSSSIEQAVEDAISQVQVYPERRTAAHHTRSPSDTSEEDISSGSDGGEEYSSTQFDGDSSDEEEGLHRENGETWELIEI